MGNFDSKQIKDEKKKQKKYALNYTLQKLYLEYNLNLGKQMSD